MPFYAVAQRRFDLICPKIVGLIRAIIPASARVIGIFGGPILAINILRRGVAAALATGLLGSASAFVCAGNASAQTIPLSFQRQNDSIADTPILDRQHPDYDPQGDELGSFVLLPKFSLGEVYDDNIFAASSGGVSDFRTSLDPEITLKSDWARHAVQFHVLGDIEEYVSHPTENAANVSANLYGRYDGPDDLTIEGESDFSRESESRATPGSPHNTVNPIIYDVGHVEVDAFKTFNRLRITLETSNFDYTYDNGKTPAGVTVVQDINNSVDLYQTVKAEYALSSRTGLVVDLDTNERQFQYQPPTAEFNRNSSGIDIAGGVSLDFTHLIRGQVLVGYLDQSYQSSAFHSVTGPSAHIKLLYLPTSLTNISFTLDRKVNDAQEVAASSFLTTGYHVEIDHELFRNLNLIGWFEQGNDEYKGVDRTDKHYEGQINATYLLNRHVNLKFSLDDYDLSSTGTDKFTSYNVGQLTLALVIQL